MTILITGASGAMGRKVTAKLLEKLPPSELILVTRHPDSLAELAGRGVRVRYGDFDQPESLPAAFTGAERMLLISTLDVGANRRRQHRAAIEAAARAGVPHVAYTSSVGIHPSSPAFVIEDHLYTEELLRASGLAWTFLRDAQYAEVLTTMIAPVALASGRWTSSSGDGCMAFVSKEDCVAAAAGVLTTPGHEGATYEITGPELLSFRDAAALLSELVGRRIEYVVVTHEQKQAEFDAAGIPRRYVEGTNHAYSGAWASDEMMSYERALGAGYFAVCSHHVQLITGRKARTLREVFQASKGALGLQ
ncbi:MAG TPA: SDR family oxidoreductase [Steroidobacteraceae bacterium]|nr:SDR family oxidoreductase [Steroidobacteraceae bacterium]